MARLSLGREEAFKRKLDSSATRGPEEGKPRLTQFLLKEEVSRGVRMTSRRRSFPAQSEPHLETVRSPSRPRSLSNTVLATAVGYGVLLLAYDVKADAEYLQSSAESNEAPFFQRVQKGPFGFSNLDRILFGAFVLMAFELLQFAVQGSGSE